MITTLENVKLILGITTDSKDALISALIPIVEADYLLIRNRAFDLDGEETVYPVGAEGVSIRMIAYHLNTQGQYGIASESLSRHSISYQQANGNGLSAMYPTAITAGIVKYADFI